MIDSKQQETKQTTPAKKAGRKSTTPATAPGGGGRNKRRKKARKLVPGAGGSTLNSAIDLLVSEKSNQIAKAIIETTIQGSIPGAKLVVDITGARHPPAKPPRKHRGLTCAQKLALEPEWEGPPDYDDDDEDDDEDVPDFNPQSNTDLHRPTF